MSFLAHAALRCPLDALPLKQDGNCLRCENKHSFDVARQGYVNLLGASDKRSRDPGDSREMVAARRRFLESGHYAPIARRIGELVGQCIQREIVHTGIQVEHAAGDRLVVDAGCGEGYYLTQLRSHLDASPLGHKTFPECQFVGFDISKWAMQLAAKRFPGTWLVASNRRIPLADSSVDVLLDMFGFCDYGEFARILKPGGALIRVGAGDRHLQQLRQLIYEQQKPAKVREGASSSIYFRDAFSDRLEFDIAALPVDSLRDLLIMTPHFYRASAAGKRRIAGVEYLDLSVDVLTDILVREGSPKVTMA